MANKHTRQFNMLARVREFGQVHPELFPKTEVVGQMFAAVGKSVDELSEHATTEVAREGTARRDGPQKAIARAALRARMGTINRTARALALDTPGLDGQFRIPSGRSDRALLTAARAFALAAAPIAADFVAHGLPKKFVAQLEASTEAFATVTHDQAASLDVSVAARASIEQSLDAGLLAVRRLDAIVPNYLGDDPAVATLWERARHIEYPKRTKAVVKAPAAPKPAVATPPVQGS